MASGSITIRSSTTTTAIAAALTAKKPCHPLTSSKACALTWPVIAAAVNEVTRHDSATGRWRGASRSVR